MTVDRHDPTPIYLQIAAILRAKILSGEYRPRQVLPSEQQLMQEHEVARATVRHAIEALRDEGLATRAATRPGPAS